MLLVGNVACLDVFNFEIVVQDSDPSNGPIIDGCGSFTYMITSPDSPSMTTEGFNGALDAGNWDVAETTSNGNQTATATFTATTLTLETSAAIFNTGASFGVTADLQFSDAGELSFDYDYNGIDAGFDDAIIMIDFEGNVINTILDTDDPATGSVTIDVEPGYTLMVELADDGFQPFDGPFTSELEISNISFGSTNLLGLDFETCWGVVHAEDKTSPEAIETPGDVTLLCVDFENDANNVSTLPASISKCYQVDGETGATLVGSMDPALRARLLAGGISPLVPTFTDGCASVLNVCVSDAVTFGEDPSCDDIVLTRTFVATEDNTCTSAAGEENAPAVASYQITFERPTLDDLSGDAIDAVVEIESCGSDPSARPAPRASDFPFLQIGDRTFFLSDGEAVCNIGVTYSDGPAIVTCPFTYKFVRTSLGSHQSITV